MRNDEMLKSSEIIDDLLKKIINKTETIESLLENAKEKGVLENIIRCNCGC